MQTQMNLHSTYFLQMDKNHYAVQSTIIAQMLRLLEMNRFAIGKKIFLKIFQDKKLPSLAVEIYFSQPMFEFIHSISTLKILIEMLHIRLLNIMFVYMAKPLRSGQILLSIFHEQIFCL